MFGENLFEIKPGVNTRWASFENPDGVCGMGGKPEAAVKGQRGLP